MAVEKVELVAPAKDFHCGRAAIEHGADAVYMGGPSFSARAAAGNSLQEIEKMVNFAHGFHARVYLALNTLLSDRELDEAVALIHQSHDIGVDAVIIQDLGLLECELPPIALHASTQVDNRTVKKIEFLQNLGFRQAVLARELSLEQIKEIAGKSEITLECFVHGALCVSYSGQCYISEAMSGRSANRGSCAQYCRHQYSLYDGTGQKISSDKYLLSLKDLNLSSQLHKLIGAGVRSFKIEGRLKDVSYVKNITALYRQEIDRLLEDNPDLARASSGVCHFSFVPNAQKTFQRGNTTYFLHGVETSSASLDSPKSHGEKLGKVVESAGKSFVLETESKLNNGDGLYYFTSSKELVGFRLNRVDGRKLFPHRITPPPLKSVVYRNYDVEFHKRLEVSEKCRRVGIFLTVRDMDSGLHLATRDEDGICSEYELKLDRPPAENPEKIADIMRRQLSKSGESIFRVDSVQVEGEVAYYSSVSQFNQLRREALAHHLIERLNRYSPPPPGRRQGASNLIGEDISRVQTYSNKMAEKLYERFGIETVSPESRPRELMRCKYCLKRELDFCPKLTPGKKGVGGSFVIKDKRDSYKLMFDCEKCEMIVERAKKAR